MSQNVDGILYLDVHKFIIHLRLVRWRASSKQAVAKAYFTIHLVVPVWIAIPQRTWIRCTNLTRVATSVILCFRLDFFSEEGGRRNGITMGLAPVGGVCLPAHACVVSEFGTTDVMGRPYPSAGFTSVYILAHEIGHKSVIIFLFIEAFCKITWILGKMSLNVCNFPSSYLMHILTLW